MTSHVIDERYERKMQHPWTDEYYDRSGYYNYGYWTPDTTSQGAACENLVEQLLALIPDKSGRILDIACGLGASTRYLSSFYDPMDLFALNISRRQLSICRESMLGQNFICMDAARLGFAAQSFDNLICVEAAFHFRTRVAFVQGAWRLLKPGGCLVLSDILFRRWATRISPRLPDDNWVKDIDAYCRIFERAGFASVDVVDATAVTWKGAYHHQLQWWRNKLKQRKVGYLLYLTMVLLTHLADKGTRNYLLVVTRRAGRRPATSRETCGKMVQES